MSLGGVIAGGVRALAIAAATGTTAFGLLVVLHPFAAAPAQQPAVGTPASDALHRQIAEARDALRQTEAAIAAHGAPAPAAPDAATQLDAQIAAATERRDLARRHAGAIRDALGAKADLSALPDIRDSAVIGQLFTQLAGLDATIAQQGSRLRPSHPTMRGLAAQRAALLAQIAAEAGNIAGSLEAEAKLDDGQLKSLQSQRGTNTAGGPASGDLAALQAQATAQRGTLEALMDGYFGVPRDAMPPAADPILTAISPLNLFVVAVAAMAALATQIGFVLRRRRLRLEADLGRWRRDRDPEMPAPAATVPITPALRRAS